jgi:Xaa-Pro aminopeptidase
MNMATAKGKPLNNPFAKRLEDLFYVLRQKRFSALVIFDEADIRALTDIQCDSACLLLDVKNHSTTLFTDFRYIPAIQRLSPWINAVQLNRGFGELFETIKKTGAKWSKVGFEGTIKASLYLALAKALPKAKLFDAQSEILKLRSIKTHEEIIKIAEAAALNDEIWEAAKKEIKRGMTEKEIQSIIRSFMVISGDGEAFETIVCAGANAAECHHIPDDTVWKKGEALLVDMGVKLGGVCSDMTRTIASGNKEYKAVYDIVLKANMAAIEAARPGISCSELDGVAREIIAKEGFADAFGHALGHGVGFEIHESPTLRKNDTTILAPGMIVTIEPGIYIPGKFGVRIEDLVLITDDGCQSLTTSPK